MPVGASLESIANMKLLLASPAPRLKRWGRSSWEERKRHTRPILSCILFLLGGLALGSSALAAPEAADVCAKLPTHLVKLDVRKARYRPYTLDDPTEALYVGDEFAYTRFTLNGERLILATGFRFSFSDGELPDPERVSLALSSAPFFDQAEWLGGRRLWDLDLNAADQKAVRLISSILFFLADSQKADLALKLPAVAQNLSGWGVRGSNIRDWYDCQGCGLGFIGAQNWSQDLSSTRIAEIDGQLVIITTRPRTVAAIINPETPIATYIECGDEIGRLIDDDSSQFFDAISKIKSVILGR